MTSKVGNRRPSAKTCPSGPAEEGSVVLGVVAARGQLAYLTPNVPVTNLLLASLKQDGVPIENRMRFASSCIESRCIQWSEKRMPGRCGLIDHAIEALNPPNSTEPLPHCGIRGSCRWFAQHQSAACRVCPEVIRRPAKECVAAMATVAETTRR